MKLIKVTKTNGIVEYFNPEFVSSLRTSKDDKELTEIWFKDKTYIEVNCNIDNCANHISGDYITEIY